MYQPIDQATVVLARLTELSTPEAPFSLTQDSSGWWRFAVGEVGYITLMITTESLFNAYLHICTGLEKQRQSSGAV